jgi:hypothetical protein
MRHDKSMRRIAGTGRGAPARYAESIPRCDSVTIASLLTLELNRAVESAPRPPRPCPCPRATPARTAHKTSTITRASSAAEALLATCAVLSASAQTRLAAGAPLERGARALLGRRGRALLPRPVVIGIGRSVSLVALLVELVAELFGLPLVFLLSPPLPTQTKLKINGTCTGKERNSRLD